MATEHLVTQTTKYGARESGRVTGAPDCDSAAMFVASQYGGTIISVEARDSDAPTIWGQQDYGVWEQGN